MILKRFNIRVKDKQVPLATGMAVMVEIKTGGEGWIGRRVVNPEIAFEKIRHLPFLTKTFEVLGGYDD